MGDARQTARRIADDYAPCLASWRPGWALPQVIIGLVDDIADAIRAAERDAFRRAAAVARKHADGVRRSNTHRGRVTQPGEALAYIADTLAAELDRMASTWETT